MPFKRLFMVSLFLSALLPLCVSAQSDLVSAINSKLIPLKTISPDGDFSDLKPLKAILKHKKIIGLGESAHGVHDFFIFKQRMLEFLVQELGVKSILTETDFAGTQTMNDYVLHGKDDVYKGMTAMATGVWTTQEFIDMAEWVKKYNENKPDKDKVSFYGYDMTSSHSSATLLQAYLAQNSQLTPVLQQGFDALAKSPGKLTGEDRSAIKNTISVLGKVEFNLPADEAKFYKHVVRTLEQYADYTAPGVTGSPNEKNDIRDKYMAENCEWIYQYTHNGKMLISGHNEHLAKKMNNTGVTRAGIYLNEKFKDDYYLFGVCFNHGGVRSIDSKTGGYANFDVPEVTMPNNSDALFAQCSPPNFILDFKTASANLLIKDYLSKTVTSYFIGSNYAAKAGTDQMYVQHKWSEGYDGIVFIRIVSAATAVKK